MPKMSKKTEATLSKIAKRNNISKGDVVAHIEQLLRCRGVSKHYGLLCKQ